MDNETPEETAKRLNVPVIGGRKAPVAPADPNPVVAVCGVCGLTLRSVMSYTCNRSGCPTGLGGPSC